MRRKGAAECEGVACEHALGQQPLQLYAYLWSRATAADTSDAFSFVMPDTVVFRRQKPSKWLFTSKQERGKDFLVAKGAPSALATMGEDRLILASYAYLDRSPLSGEMQLIVEHLDKATLSYLLLEREKPSVSVLQRFVPTKSGYNHAIRSVYTPENCIAQKCVAPFLLSDVKRSMTQRTATFEANEPPLRCRDVSDREVLSTIEKINGEISTHLEAIVGKEMMRLVNYFKIGADNRIYLLWSSMISFDPDGKTSAKNFRLALGSQDTAPGSRSPTRTTKQLNGRFTSDQHLRTSNSQLKVCPRCRRLLPRDQVEFVVTHKTIIQQFERDAAGKFVDKPADTIPLLIRAVSGPIHAERFQQLKQTPAFLYQTVHLCMTCAQQLNTKPKPPNPRCRQPSLQLDTKDTPAPVSQPARSARDQLWSSTKTEEARRAEVPVVVQTRAVSAGPTRMRFSTSTLRKSSSLHRRHLSQFLPRLHAFEPPVMTPKDGVLQLALQLKRNYGHPSLRFALSQCNAFPIGSMVSLHTLKRVCNAELVTLATQYWTELFLAQRARTDQSAVDIDALDGLLAASVDSSKHPGAAHYSARAREAASHFQPNDRTSALVPDETESISGSCVSMHERSAAAASAPRRPDRPRSCIPASTSSRRARMASYASAQTLRKVDSDSSGGSGRSLCSAQQESHSSGGDAATASNATEESGPTSIVRIIDGVECRVRASAITQRDGQFALLLEVSPQPNASSSQAKPAMELMLSAAETMEAIGASNVAPQLRSPNALLESVLPRVRIVEGRLLIPTSPRTPQPQPPSPRHEQLRADGDALQHACPELSETELQLLAETLSKPHYT